MRYTDKKYKIMVLTVISLVLTSLIWTFTPKEGFSEKDDPVIADYTTPVAPTKLSKLSSIPAVETAPSEPTYTEDELFCMAAAIYNEAGGDACSDETRTLVGYVILNRVKDPRFPNSIREVLEAKRQYGRFYWTGVKFADRSSNPGEKAAVDRAYKIAEKVLTEPSTIPETVVFQAEFKQGVGVYKHKDGIYFCYAKEVK